MSLGLRQSRGFSPNDPDDFSVDRLRWIIRLRWIALGGMLVAAAAARLGLYPGVAWEVLVGTAVCAGIYNLILRMRHRAQATHGTREALRQGVVDMVLLTVVLWAAGGMRTPFIGYYVFHVAIVGILGGRNATVVAALAALFSSSLLLLTEHVPALQIGRWDPTWPWDLVAEVFAFVSTVGAVAYLVTHAVYELRMRERALADARAQASLELEVLTNTLDELDAGLEVVEEGGSVLWRNKRAEELATSVPSDADGEASLRFAATIDGEERLYEMTVYPLGPGPDGTPRSMNLYIDRRATLVAERRLILAERLASLGRVTQGVAHELNTPLATIRTLSADMIAALGEGSAGDRMSLIADLLESAKLVHDETRRLGRITQGLLTGRDLIASDAEGALPLPAVVERARALVFAGARVDFPVEVADLGGHVVIGDPDHIVQVLVNLLQNAYDAVREKGSGSVSVTARRDGAMVAIVIDDDGTGVSSSVEGRLFEPFATSKPPGKGTGLGLYTSYMLVTAMRGTLTLENRAEGGARATMALPSADADEASCATPVEAAQ